MNSTQKEPSLSNNAAPVGEWFERLLTGSKTQLGEALSLVEADRAIAHELLNRLHRQGGRAQIIGTTGPPGSGKSTSVNELALYFADRGNKVGIVAVDPSSPFTGGAVIVFA